MIKILAIGNSFSEDATAYLHQIAQASGIDTLVVNLYIGGCSLQTHWENITDAKADYQYQINGYNTQNLVSINDVILHENWDIITVQQASHDSGIEDTYYPYIENIVAFIKEKSPNSKIYVHETWAYDVFSTHGAFVRYDNDQHKMYSALKLAYEKAAQTINAPIIPSGDVIQYLRDNYKQFNNANGGVSLCRDGFHMHLLYGRYATAATLFKTLIGGDISSNSFVPPISADVVESSVDMDLIKIIKDTVNLLCPK